MIEQKRGRERMTTMTGKKVRKEELIENAMGEGRETEECTSGRQINDHLLK